MKSLYLQCHNFTGVREAQIALYESAIANRFASIHHYSINADVDKPTLVNQVVDAIGQGFAICQVSPYSWKLLPRVLSG